MCPRSSCCRYVPVAPPGTHGAAHCSLQIYYERSEKIRQMVLAKNGGVTEEDLSKALERHSGNRKIKQLTDMLAQLTDAMYVE